MTSQRTSRQTHSDLMRKAIAPATCYRLAMFKPKPRLFFDRACLRYMRWAMRATAAAVMALAALFCVFTALVSGLGILVEAWRRFWRP